MERRVTSEVGRKLSQYSLAFAVATLLLVAVWTNYCDILRKSSLMTVLHNQPRIMAPPYLSSVLSLLSPLIIYGPAEPSLHYLL